MDRRLLNSLIKTAASMKRRDITDPAFHKQQAFLRAEAKLRALWCTRRAAKSYTGGLGLVQAGLDYPLCNTLYLGLTRSSAKRVVWKDILKSINRKHRLGMSFNGSELTATMPNGSVIYATGVDADEDEMHKLLGMKWKRVVIDEAQSYSIDLRALVYGVLGPAVVDQGGDIWLLGTSGNVVQGLFFDVTNHKEPGWELFQWTAYDNPYVAKQWKQEIEKIALTRPEFMKTALFRQWYLNEWVIDEDAKVYRYRDGDNQSQALPHLSGWRYCLGLDLAHSPDSTAFVVGAYTPEDPHLYFVYAEKKKKLDITGVAEHIKLLEKTYNFDAKVVDGANKQAVAELNNRHSLGLIAADKTGKADFIRIMNDDFIQGRIKLLPAAQPLAEEYKTLVWLTDENGKIIEPRVENPVIPNDAADGALYLWRFCYQYLFKTPEKTPAPGTVESWEPAHIAKLQDQVRRAENPNELDLQWEETWDDQLDEDGDL